MSPPIVLAHRGLWVPKKSEQNTRNAVELAVKSNSYGIEIDIRKGVDGELYIVHDATPDRVYPREQRALGIFEILRDAKMVALNWKEPGVEKDLITLCDHMGLLGRSFIFDQPSSVARQFPYARYKMDFAVRVSDRPDETVAHALRSKAPIVWADEFAYPCITEDLIDMFHDHGKQVYCVSPELHGFARIYAWQRWRAWTKADGICTDDPQELEQFLKDYAPVDIGVRND